MDTVITTPCETVRQVSAQLEGEGYVLSVLAKRTYRIDRRGRCVLSDEQLPLQIPITYEDEDEELVAADTDVVHFKPLTDVVVRGHGYAQKSQAELGIGIRVGAASKLVVAIGQRRASIDPRGRVLFSAPQPFTKIPLSYALAYGGRDALAEAKHGIPAAKFVQYLPAGMDIKRLSPFIYPRNPAGRGYLVEASREAVEALELPQLEDPDDRVTPERLAAGDPRRWTQMPVPQSLGWYGHTWFPRSVHFGAMPDCEPPTSPPFEVTRGWAPANILQGMRPNQRFSMRAANGASMGLQLPYLNGNEDGTLHGLSPLGEVVPFKLPGERPRIWTDGRKGKLNKTSPVVHTVLIEPDQMRLSIVWRGHAPALRPYYPPELAKMPLKVEW